MSDHDRIDIDGLTPKHPTSASHAKEGASGSKDKKFLMVWFKCCHAYGRLNRNGLGTHFVGRCPRCGSQVSARIGDGGTDRRIFEAR